MAFPTLQVTDANGVTQTINTLPGANTVLSGTAAANGVVLASFDASDLTLIMAQLGGTFVATVQGQFRNDASLPWVPVNLIPVTGSPSTNATATGLYMIPVLGKFFQLITTAYTSGTVNAFCFESNMALPLTRMGVLNDGNFNINSITTLPALPAGTNLIGDIATAIRTNATNAIVSNARLVSAAASTNGTVVKASAGRVYKIEGYNAAAAVRYLKFSNSTTITVGTTAVVDTFALKPNDYFDFNFGPIGRGYSTGICYGLTVNSADNDTTALTAADIVGLNVYFA